MATYALKLESLDALRRKCQNQCQVKRISTLFTDGYHPYSQTDIIFIHMWISSLFTNEYHLYSQVDIIYVYRQISSLFTCEYHLNLQTDIFFINFGQISSLSANEYYPYLLSRIISVTLQSDKGFVIFISPIVPTDHKATSYF